MSQANPPVFLLMGPTAVGKTDLALRLVEALPILEIISVDSALIYRGMDIGAGKPSQAILQKIPHHLIDHLDPSESYSAALFLADVAKALAIIKAKGKIPLLVGGTMLYFKALKSGLADIPAADEAIRKQLWAEKEAFGLGHLAKRLALFDPASAKRIHPNDPQRILRALEIFALTGKPWSAHLQHAQNPIIENPMIEIVLAPGNREILHQRIAQRFHAMLALGFVEEVATLKRRVDLNPHLPSMRAVGYRQIWGYLAGEYGEREMQEKAIAATRQLAKRQLTWLNNSFAAQHRFDSEMSSAFHKIRELMQRSLGS
jgi:tRNA dimethylallyltransferase